MSIYDEPTMPKMTSKALRAWGIYRDLGTGRTLEEVGRTLGQSRQSLEGWSVKFGWFALARAHDARIAAVTAARDIEKKARAAERMDALRERARSHRSIERDSFRKWALDAMKKASDTGEIGPGTALQIIRFVEESERRDLEEPDQRIELGGPGGGAIPLIIIPSNGRDGPDTL